MDKAHCGRNEMDFFQISLWFGQTTSQFLIFWMQNDKNLQGLVLWMIKWKSTLIFYSRKELPEAILSNNCRKTDQIFNICTSIPQPGYPLVPGGRLGTSYFNFKAFGCDPEVLRVLETKNCSKNGFFWWNLAAFWGFWILAPPNPHGRT